MGLIDYMSRSPLVLAILPNEYDEEFVVASINGIINNLEMIDNVIPNNLANRIMAPCQLIKKRAEDKRLQSSCSNSQLKVQHFADSGSGHLQTFKLNQLCSKPSQTQSA